MHRRCHVRSDLFSRVVGWWTDRRELAFQLRVCGGNSPRVFESNAKRAARVKSLAQRGVDMY